MKAVAVCLFLMPISIFKKYCVLQIFQLDCSGYEKLPSGVSPPCIRIYEPVCSSNGKTYINRCFCCIAVQRSDNKIKFSHYGWC
uniref:Kazal-like domain-containing protein n=1 Tax=Monodelphis domestica TaxID=13616 RepID=A0A5F8HF89_MONDO